MGLEEFELIGESPPMQDLERVLRRVAPTDAIVLTHGESGTGKELVARAIHQLGVDPKRPFVTVECTNIPATLMESELFGHEAGASTDPAPANRSPRVLLAARCSSTRSLCYPTHCRRSCYTFWRRGVFAALAGIRKSPLR